MDNGDKMRAGFVREGGGRLMGTAQERGEGRGNNEVSQETSNVFFVSPVCAIGENNWSLERLCTRLFLEVWDHRVPEPELRLITSRHWSRVCVLRLLRNLPTGLNQHAGLPERPGRLLLFGLFGLANPTRHVSGATWHLRSASVSVDGSSNSRCRSCLRMSRFFAVTAFAAIFRRSTNPRGWWIRWLQTPCAYRLGEPNRNPRRLTSSVAWRCYRGSSFFRVRIPSSSACDGMIGFAATPEPKPCRRVRNDTNL
jgi:hypothetical protein